MEITWQLCGLIAPFLINKLILYLQKKEGTFEEALLIAFALVFTQFVRQVLQDHKFCHNLASGNVSRKTLEYMVYKKQLQVTRATGKVYDSGQIDFIYHHMCGGLVRFSW